MSEIETSHAEEQHRYEARVAGELAGFAEYQLAEGIVVFTHTEVDDRFEGQGVGSALARAALDDVRDQGTGKVIATCPFIKGWIDRHPDYHALLYGAGS
ncbi:MAG: N-acetyltransferase [Actinobacteria bacterium]|jgi:uncharacterized protein|nr:N-acetyltransferase [Actinomycetota bacterium]